MKKSNIPTVKNVTNVDLRQPEGFSIGHAQNQDGLTGCTVILCHRDGDYRSGMDVRGGLPGTRNGDMMDPRNAPDCCDAILLSGGSYFGMAAASGVEKYLEEKGIGTHVRGILIPSVVQAIIFDLAVGDADCRPDARMGYEACLDAERRGQWKDGNTGAGTGAAVGKLAGMDHAIKGGVGYCCLSAGTLFVAALMVVNAVGDVVDSKTGGIIAGALRQDKTGFADSEQLVLENYEGLVSEGGNTTIGAILTNAKMTKGGASKLSGIAQDGLARAIRPVHTMRDGDAVITVSSGKIEANSLLLEVMAVKATETAILNAVLNAVPAGGLPCAQDFAPQIQKNK